ncbi:hypothetical protein Tco_1365697, partial [Tanacetum coccineum]
TGNKENKDTVPKKETITDDIYNWITAKYEAPNETWNADQVELVADDVFKTFYDKSDSEQDVVECSTKATTVSKCSTKEATVPECSMIKANVPECSTKKATKDVASHIAAKNIVDPQTKVIKISSGTDELECTSTEELESSSTSELESSSTEDDSDDEEFSSSSAELVTCTLVSTKKRFSDEVKDDTEEEAEDDTDDEAEDETWSPKTIGTTSKK